MILTSVLCRPLAILAVAAAALAQEPPRPPAEPAPQPAPQPVQGPLGQPPPAPAAPTPLGETGLAIVLPDGYQVVEHEGLGLLFLAAAPAADGFSPNLNLTRGPESLPAQPDRAAIRSELTAALAKILDGYQFVADGELEVLGRKTVWASSRFRQGDKPLRNFQVLVPAAPAYWCTFTTRDDRYDQQIDAVRAALATLQRTGAPALRPLPAHRRDGEALVVDELGFAFAPPAGWDPGPVVAPAFLQCYAPADDGFSPNVSVQEGPAARERDPAEVRKALETDLPRLSPGAMIEEVEPFTVDGRRGAQARFFMRLGRTDMAVTQFHVPGEGRSFTITYTVRAADGRKMRAPIEQSARTIRLTPPAARASKGG